MNFKLIIFFCLACTITAQAQKPFALVELFTSEGCNTCPPADKVLATMKADAEQNHKEIYFLEYHVDYWNKLGWKDPYSMFQFTMRQKNYTSALNEESLYTPMMIINGKNPFTGSDAAKATAAVSAALKKPATVQLKITVDSVASDTIYMSYRSSAFNENYFIRAAVAQDDLQSTIHAGENAGKTLTHEAVVRKFFSKDLEAVKGQLHIPLKGFKPDSHCRLIAFIQHKQTMEVLAVTSSDFK